jgi:hypothetical protein
MCSPACLPTRFISKLLVIKQNNCYLRLAQSGFQRSLHVSLEFSVSKLLHQILEIVIVQFGGRWFSTAPLSKFNNV